MAYICDPILLQVNFRIVKEVALSGSKATIYSIILEEDEESNTTLLEHFVDENKESNLSEVQNILQRLRTVGQKTGVREHFFKNWEGAPGDGVCALYDDPDKNLRLYCITFGTAVLVVGGGGLKPKSIRALQEDVKLTLENNRMKVVSKAIEKRIRDKEIYWSSDGQELLGDFNFKHDE